jgi:hypothetical protein
MATEAEIFSAVDRMRVATSDLISARKYVQEAQELRNGAIAQLQRAQDELTKSQAALVSAREALKVLLNA